MCKSWCEFIVAVVVIVFALWDAVYASFGKWILVLAGILLLIHSFTCKKCFTGHAATSKQKRK